MTSDRNLNDNPNPYSGGSPSVDAERESLYPGSGPEGYFDVTGLPEAGSNPQSQGAPWSSDPRTDATGYIANNFDSLYGDILDNRQPVSDSMPTSADYSFDLGTGRDGNGRS